jgi:hypothetical protein
MGDTGFYLKSKKAVNAPEDLEKGGARSIIPKVEDALKIEDSAPCAWEKELSPEEKLKKDSEELGVQLQFVLGAFPSCVPDYVRKEMEREGTKIEAYGKVDPKNPNFHSIAMSMFYGPNGWGFKEVCPRDGKKSCAFVDALKVPQKGKANVFCSWVWSYPMLTFLDALTRWADKKQVDRATTYVWICAFCNNQYRIMNEKNGDGAEDLETVFQGRMRACGRVVAVLDAWEQPLYLTRIWCVFEQYTAQHLNVPVEFTLPTDQEESFANQLGSIDLVGIKKKLEAIDCRDATATQPNDEEKVKRLIEMTYGHDEVNVQIRKRFIGWITEVVTKKLNS